LNDAVRHAVELEAFNRAEKKTLESQGLLRAVRNTDTSSKQKPNEEIEMLKKSMDELKATMKSLQSQLGESNNTRFARKPFTCYECCQEGHSKRYCPELRWSTDNVQGNPKEASSVKRSSCTGSGLYVEAKINGTPATCLIDTGATLTIVSSKFMDSVQALSSLESFKHNIFTASGTVMQSIGKTSVIIEIGGFETLVNVVVANIDAEVILGLDYMTSQGIMIDISNENMVIHGKVCKLNCVGPIGCCRVRLHDTKVCYEKRFKCEICTKTFKKSKYLGRHMKLKHRKTTCDKVVANKDEGNFENGSRMDMSPKNSVRVPKSDVILRHKVAFNDRDLLSEQDKTTMELCNFRKRYKMRSGRICVMKTLSDDCSVAENLRKSEAEIR
jgi:predicted aspartyl protease